MMWSIAMFFTAMGYSAQVVPQEAQFRRLWHDRASCLVEAAKLERVMRTKYLPYTLTKVDCISHAVVP